MKHRRIVVAITLIVSMLCALVIGYNMYQTHTQEDTKLLEFAVTRILEAPSVISICNAPRIECTNVSFINRYHKNLSNADKLTVIPGPS